MPWSCTDCVVGLNWKVRVPLFGSGTNCCNSFAEIGLIAAPKFPPTLVAQAAQVSVPDTQPGTVMPVGILLEENPVVPKMPARSLAVRTFVVPPACGVFARRPW